ncbi:MAG: hypothetical protein ACLU4N_04000 [Butyricimonas faecihominis]
MVEKGKWSSGTVDEFILYFANHDPVTLRSSDRGRVDHDSCFGSRIWERWIIVYSLQMRNMVDEIMKLVASILAIKLIYMEKLWMLYLPNFQ